MPDVNKACERFEKMGVEFIKKPDAGTMKGLAFIKVMCWAGTGLITPIWWSDSLNVSTVYRTQMVIGLKS